jgi:signal transduction histidine kinase
LSVRDTGPGIPEAVRAHAFEPFRRAAAGKGSGTGLGLALVRQIARRHGGEAQLGAAPSEIVVTLPLRRP